MYAPGTVDFLQKKIIIHFLPKSNSIKIQSTSSGKLAHPIAIITTIKEAIDYDPRNGSPIIQLNSPEIN